MVSFEVGSAILTQSTQLTQYSRCVEEISRWQGVIAYFQEEIDSDIPQCKCVPSAMVPAKYTDFTFPHVL